MTASTAPHRPTVRLHNSSVTHAGTVIGRYPETGNPRYRTRCGAERRGPSHAYAATGEVTCKRCLATLARLDAALEAREAPAEAPALQRDLAALQLERTGLERELGL